MTRRRAAAVAALVAAFVLGGPGAAAGAATSGSPVAAPVAGPRAEVAAPAVDLGLAGIAPAAVRPGDTLDVMAMVHNSGDLPLVGAEAALRLRPERIATRQQLRRWMEDGDPAEADRVLPGTRRLPPIAPGEKIFVSLSVPAQALGLPGAAAQFGPRGLVVEIRSGDRRLAQLRTTVVWYPGKEFSPTRLSLLVPLTGPADPDAAGATGRSAEALAGPLDNLLTAASTDPDVAWAVDPAVLLGARRLATDGVTPEGDDRAEGEEKDGEEKDGEEKDGDDVPAGTASPAAASPTAAVPTTTGAPAGGTGTGTGGPADSAEAVAARTWLQRFEAGRQNREVIALPFADPDLAALGRARSGAMMTTARNRGTAATTRALGTSLDDTTSWPAGGSADDVTLTALAQRGARSMILAEGAQPPREETAITPTGRGRFDTSGGRRVESLLYDEQLSALFGGTGGTSSAAATQHLLAELATITLELPSRPRHVLAVAPRGWNPDPGAVGGALQTLRAADWVDLRPLSDLRDAAPTVDRGAPVHPPAAASAELPEAHVAAVVTAYRDVRAFAPALVTEDGPGEDEVVGPLLERSLSLVSAAWRADREGLPAARDTFLDTVERITDGPRIVPGSRINWLASESKLPVTVANRSPYPVRVLVTLRPTSGRIVVEKPVETEIPAGTRRMTVYVPARAVTSGDVKVEASLRTSAGDLVGETKVLDLLVLRGWETRGLIVVGALLGLLLVVGLLRGVRGDRSRVPPEAVPDVDDLALAPGDTPWGGLPVAAAAEATDPGKVRAGTGAAEGSGTGSAPGSPAAAAATPAPPATTPETGEPGASGSEEGRTTPTGQSDRAAHSLPSAGGPVEGADPPDRAAMARETR